MPGRQRLWKNETVDLAPASGAQVITEFATGLTDKGDTLQRLIVEFAITPGTVNVNTRCHLAIWIGPLNGEPANIQLADNASYLYWTGVILNLSNAVATGATERFQYRHFDVKGQRVFRSDFDGLWIIARADGNSAMSVFTSIRTLVLKA